jgi:hypothetical protein
MAYIVDYSIFSATAAAAAVAMPMPSHQTNDLLIAFVTTGNATVATVGAGSSPVAANWSTLSDTTVTAATTTVLYTIATASNNVLNLTTGDDYAITIISVRDVDVSNGRVSAINASSVVGNAVASGAPVNLAASTNATDCLMLYMVAPDSQAATVATHINPGYHHIVSHDNGSVTANTSSGHGLGWTIWAGTGNSPTPGWTTSASQAYGRATIAVKNAAGGRIPPYLDRTTSATYLVPGHSIATVANQTYTFTGSNTLTGNMTNGKTATSPASYIAPQAAASTDLGINVFSAAMSKTSAIQAATAFTGFECTLSGARNFTTELIVGSVIGGTPKMGAFGIGSVTEGGCVVRVGSAAGAWRAYQVAAKDSVPNTATRVVFAIEPGFATSQYGVAGSWNLAATTSFIQFLSNQPSFASSVNWSDICLVGAHVISGGTPTFPIDTEGMAQIGRSYRIPVIQQTGGAGLLSYVPIQIGGADAVDFVIDAGSLQFPRRYDTTKKEISFHASNGKVGIGYAGKSGDIVKHTNSIITSPTPFYWRIDATATNAATWDFTGTTVVNAIVTLRNVTTFNSMSFSDCVSMDASASTVTNTDISLVSTTNNPLVVTSTSSFSNCNFDTTGISVGIGMVSLTTTTGVPFSNCIFTGSGTTGHAIIITVPGTYSFNNLTFNSYGGTPGDNATPNSGSTSAAVYNNSGGAVIIQVTGGAQPSVRNGASATTDVQASASVIIDGLVADSEVRAYTGTNPATAVEIAGTESSTGTSFTFSQSSSGVAGYIQIFHVEYQPIFRAITYSGSNQTITIQQIKDRQYARGSTFTPT